MSQEIDYDSVEVPPDRSTEDYHYTHRRAEILRLLREAGHPRVLNQARLARRYGCTRQNIANDIDVLGEYVDRTLGSRRILTTKIVYDWSIKTLIEREEPRKAAQTAKELNEWIEGREDIQELREEIDDLRAMIEGDDSDGE
jgi:hypothetical protein